MKLTRLNIKEFKNLINFNLDFTDKNGITVLIGNNGCGKSNIIEAISGIFRSLYLITDSSKRVDFDFELDYSINIAETNHEIKVVFTDNTFTITSNQDGNITQANTLQYLPSQLVALYSGEESRLWKNYYESFYLNYNTAIISNTKNIESSQQMLYINKYYWDIALLVMLANDIDLSGIIGDITLDTIDITFNLANINRFAEQNPNETLNFIGGLSQEKEWMSTDLEEFKTFADFETAIRMFKFLSVSYLPKTESNKLITNINLTFSNGTETNSFSEGEKKKILLKLVMDVLADDKSLVLLDEPDSHIHIAHKKQIKEMIENSERESILTTHSPTLMNVFDEHLVYLQNGEIKGRENAEILENIAGDEMSISEQQLILNTTRHIFLVEGKTDIIYMENALKTLGDAKYDTIENNFEYIPTGGASGLNLFIDKFKPKDNQLIIAIVDNDTAGNTELKKIIDDEKAFDDKDYFKLKTSANTYLLKLPRPSTITSDQYEIEDYLPRKRFLEISDDLIKTFKSLKGFNLKKDTMKKKLASKCEKGSYGKDDFLEFKKLFDLILEIKTN
ncbi:ATP-dependent nuclease [Winogradskyella undariae]|uniref:ATP-dependent nuclease n=1 Tax=Winogradskyella undariae TaxID=1285465 RepID=UPI0015C74D1E|nr:AAA family ATPase [Winogradskyella undariae]